MSNLYSCLGRFRRVVSVCTLALGLYVTSAHAQTFSPPSSSPPNSISSMSTSATYPTMVVDALGHINMAWIDSVSGIIFARYSDTSQSFVTMPVATNSVGAAFQPQMVVDPTGNIIEIAWAKPSATSGKFDVFVSRLTASGSTFLVIGTTQVSTNSVALVSAPRLAFVGAGVDVVWGNDGVWISQSTTNGLSFGRHLYLSATVAQDSGGPRIAVDSNANIFVAWTDRLAQDQGLSETTAPIPRGTPTAAGLSLFIRTSSAEITTSMRRPASVECPAGPPVPIHGISPAPTLKVRIQVTPMVITAAPMTVSTSFSIKTIICTCSGATMRL